MVGSCCKLSAENLLEGPRPPSEFFPHILGLRGWIRYPDSPLKPKYNSFNQNIILLSYQIDLFFPLHHFI